MEIKLKDHYNRCETQVKDIENKCDNIDKKYDHAIVSLSNEVRDNRIEHTDRLKEIDQNLEKVIKQVGKKHTTVIYQGHTDDCYNTVFKGGKFENPIEFLYKCKKEMDSVENTLSDEEKTNWVARNLQESAQLWYNIIREKFYGHFKKLLEEKYWNSHIQSQLRDKLEFGKY